MFNSFAFQAVDGVQSAKKQFVSTFVPQEQIKSALNSFVDAQTQYTKDAITAGSVAFTKVTEVFTDRTPYVKFAETLQSYFPTAACAKPTSKKAK
jgi:hypothetical protein